MLRKSVYALVILMIFTTGFVRAQRSFRQETRADLAEACFGVTGKGVVIVILDRGTDSTHPDFIKPDGNTRIKWMLDLSGQNLNDPYNPPGVEYSEADINAALHGGSPLAERDTGVSLQKPVEYHKQAGICPCVKDKK